MPKQWLMKSEPESFSISDLERVKIEPWSGVRNYLARNHMRAMAVGDQLLFHHSSVDPPGVAGLAQVVRIGVVDETQFDPDSPYFDPKATRDTPVWDCVEVAYVETFPHFVSMDRLRSEPALTEMMVLRRGMRLSVQPVREDEYVRIVELGHLEPPAAPPKAPSVPPPTKTATKRKVKGRAITRSKPQAGAKKAKVKRTKPGPRVRKHTRQQAKASPRAR